MSTIDGLKAFWGSTRRRAGKFAQSAGNRATVLPSMGEPYRDGLGAEQVLQRMARKVPIEGSLAAYKKLVRSELHRYHSLLKIEYFDAECMAVAPFSEVVHESSTHKLATEAVLKQLCGAFDHDLNPKTEVSSTGSGKRAWFGFGISAFALSESTTDLEVAIYDPSEKQAIQIPFSSASTGILIGFNPDQSPHHDAENQSFAHYGDSGYSIFVGRIPVEQGLQNGDQLHARLLVEIDGTLTEAAGVKPVLLDINEPPATLFSGSSGAQVPSFEISIRSRQLTNGVSDTIYKTAREAFESAQSDEEFLEGYAILGFVWPQLPELFRLVPRSVLECQVPVSYRRALISAACQDTALALTVGSKGHITEGNGDFDVNMVHHSARRKACFVKRHSGDYCGFIRSPLNKPRASTLNRLRDRLLCKVERPMQEDLIVPYSKLVGEEVKPVKLTWLKEHNWQDFYQDIPDRDYRIDLETPPTEVNGIIMAKRIPRR